jgi:glutathione synthase/RimK-type ligase-like ATP-grasp enzyme
MTRIGLVTALAAQELDTDLEPLASAVRASGGVAEILCWDDPGVDWAAYDAVVLRSAWDYPERLGRFFAWVETVSRATRVFNPPSIIRWNADKRYLADLIEDGVPTVPTTFVPPGGTLELPETVPEVVVKPALSAGSRDTARFARSDPALHRLAAHIHASGRTVMLQPYLAGVDTSGEHALVWFDGEPSHAFRKGPILEVGAAPTDALFAEEHITPAVATEAQIEVGQAALASATTRTGTHPLYARVDVVPGPDGSPVVLELELIEPSVYHHVDSGSARRFADAILSRIATTN